MSRRDVSDDMLRWLVNLNTGLKPKLSRLASVFGLSDRLIQKVKWLNVSLNCSAHCWSVVTGSLARLSSIKSAFLTMSKSVQPHNVGQGLCRSVTERAAYHTSDFILK